MRPPTFVHERALAADGYLAIGVDEAGCGCLAGPVVAAACHLPFMSRIGLLRDSKLLSAAQRARVLALLAARGAQWAVGIASVEEIDRLNIRQATLVAMRRAVEAFTIMTNGECRMTKQCRMTKEQSTERPSPNFQPITLDICHSPIDSTFDIRHSKFLPYLLVDAWTIPAITIPQRGIVHGDRLVKSIAAASIVAKCSRDAMMDTLHRAYPQYGFAAHRGYATEQHRNAIQEHGTTPHHRKSFCAHLTAVG